MMQILSLPYYHHPQIDPLSPDIVQTRVAYFHQAFAGTCYTPALVPLPWALESLKGSRWGNVYTGEQVCIRDFGYQSGTDKYYPLFDTHYPAGPLSSIGEWGDNFTILQWVRLDTASAEATLPWYLFLQEFLWNCLHLLSCESKNVMTLLQKMTLEHQCSQVQNVIDAITELGSIRNFSK